jgi:beta-lactamase regulating signal transducer with metallopeptidase domain
MARVLVECAVRGTLMAAVTVLILWATRVKTPVAVHAAWTGVVLSMLLLPVWTMWGPRASMRVLPPVPARREIVTTPQAAVPEAQQAERGRSDTVESVTAQAQSSDWQRALLGLYVLVASALLARLAIGTVSTQRLVRSADRRDGRLTSPRCAAPITVGWFRPVAILPEHSQAWTPAQLDAVLTHEHEHARRRDPLVQWLALLNRAIFWFHPLAWWLERRLATLAENTCDAAVLARGHDARDYAEYLVDIARAVTRAGSRVKVVGTAMPGPHLAWRIQQILNRVPEPRTSRTRLAWMVAACVVSSVVCAAATLEPASPERAAELSRSFGRFQQTGWRSALQQPLTRLVQTTTPIAPAGAGARAEPILVTVNGDNLTNTDLTQRHQEFQETIPRVDSGGQWRLGGGSQQRPQVLVDAVDDTLIVQRGQQLGYTLTDDQFKQLLVNIKRYHKIENDAQWLAALRRLHMTIADLRRNSERRLFLQRVRMVEVFGEGFYTEDELRQYFEAHLSEFPLMSFDQAREQIAAQPKLQQRKWDEYLATLRSKAVVEWKRADLRRAYMDGLTQRANAPN